MGNNLLSSVQEAASDIFFSSSRSEKEGGFTKKLCYLLKESKYLMTDRGGRDTTTAGSVHTENDFACCCQGAFFLCVCVCLFITFKVLYNLSRETICSNIGKIIEEYSLLLVLVCQCLIFGHYPLYLGFPHFKLGFNSCERVRLATQETERKPQVVHASHPS